ncbi:ROK family protein [Thalassoroseus pseudoceratinae]|uniref:ROK family protein n=1 Tax=Thalassoroseus pseudoceratinae TaxID=2713176 RepID=UPI001422CE02|nr:ROK family protein [Thalassoroseus pseudoceratinae]
MSEQTPKTHWLGFDLGGTKMMATVFDDQFKPLGSKRKRTKGYEGLEAGLERIEATILKALDDAEIDADGLAAIGIGCPGPIDVERGRMIEAPNLGWRNVDIADKLRKKFGCQVVVLNDVDAGVYGEYLFGAGKRARCVVGVFPGTGIGGGCVYRGEIIQGRHVTCMEVGHTQIMAGGPITGNDRQGSLESVASRLAIAAAAAQEAYRGEAPHLRKAVGTNIADIRSGALADSVENGDDSVKRIIKSAAAHIGNAVGGLVHLLAPEVIVLGGGLVEAMPELYVKEVEKTVADFIMPSYKKTYRIETAKLGDDAAVLGAAAWAKHVLTDAAAPPVLQVESLE